MQELDWNERGRGLDAVGQKNHECVRIAKAAKDR